jgi:chromosome segregation ATPase
MAVKDAQEVTDLNQDVEIIRDILFGKHLQKLSKQLDSLGEAVAALQGALDTEAASREEGVQAGVEQINAVQRELNQELKDLNKKLSKQFKDESQATKNALDGLRDEFTKQFQQLQGEIDGQQAQLNNLIGTLASALTDYQDQDAGE